MAKSQKHKSRKHKLRKHKGMRGGQMLLSSLPAPPPLPTLPTIPTVHPWLVHNTTTLRGGYRGMRGGQVSSTSSSGQVGSTTTGIQSTSSKRERGQPAPVNSDLLLMLNARIATLPPTDIFTPFLTAYYNKFATTNYSFETAPANIFTSAVTWSTIYVHFTQQLANSALLLCDLAQLLLYLAIFPELLPSSTLSAPNPQPSDLHYSNEMIVYNLLMSVSTTSSGQSPYYFPLMAIAKYPVYNILLEQPPSYIGPTPEQIISYKASIPEGDTFKSFISAVSDKAVEFLSPTYSPPSSYNPNMVLTLTCILLYSGIPNNLILQLSFVLTICTIFPDIRALATGSVPTPQPSDPNYTTEMIIYNMKFAFDSLSTTSGTSPYYFALMAGAKYPFPSGFGSTSTGVVSTSTGVVSTSTGVGSTSTLNTHTLGQTQISPACVDFVFDSSNTAQTDIINISWPTPTVSGKTVLSYTFAMGSRTISPVVIATSITNSVSIDLLAIQPIVSRLASPTTYFITSYSDGTVGLTTVGSAGCATQSGGNLAKLSKYIKNYGHRIRRTRRAKRN